MNSKCKFFIVFSLIFLFATLQVQAEKYKGPVVKKSSKADAECAKPSKTIELSLNNVRAFLKTNGTMWFRENAEYEIPKGSGKTSLFSGALWIGGVDDAGNVRVAAMRFAQDGNDYWTGPLKVDNASISPASCAYWDRFFPISRVEVERHIVSYKDPNYNMPQSIRDWPAHGRAAFGESRYLAPYCEVGGDGNTYEPDQGDFPYYDFPNALCPWTTENLRKARQCPWLDINGKCDAFGTIENPNGLPLTPERKAFRQNPAQGWDNMQIYADHVLKGDETIFWFLNDRGGKHTESGSRYSIGLEIRVQAFAFATNDELNKMTFYSYEIINRGSTTLRNTYFSQWCDPDLGYAKDDYVGCDIMRGLGYCYNGKPEDKGAVYAYGANPPAVGLDFFQGPYIDKDGTDSPPFYANLADVNGNPEQIEYCERFVKKIFEKWGKEGNNWWAKHGPDNLSDTIVVSVGGKKETVRWNDQFAINGVNFNDSIVDNERFGMRAFVYHNNISESSPTSDPHTAIEHYNLLTGKWKTGAYMYYGGSAYLQNPTISDVITVFMFPEGTDFCNWGTRGVSPGTAFNGGGKTGNWSEYLDNNPPEDRRFMQSAGPFTLIRGACNYVTVGIPWARANAGGNRAALPLLFVADDKAQALFENCFKIIDGPDAPHLTIREYDRKLIMLLSNPPYSNNANEDYVEEQKLFPDSVKLSTGWVKNGVDYDRKYRFEGYQIYQVKGPEVGANGLDNPSEARLIMQYDIVNYNEKTGDPIGRIINWEFEGELGTAVPKEKVYGSNTGIEHSFEFTRDAFSQEVLVNYKTYYFIAVAYAYNEYLPFYVDEHNSDGLWGNKLPYLRGRKTPEGKSVTPIQGIPHPPTVHGGGLTLNSNYGNIPVITRIDGQGNGGIALDISKETREKIARGGDRGDYRVREIQYEKNAGPLNVKVIDPLRVRPFDYTLVILDTAWLKHDTIVPVDMKNKRDIDNGSIWILTIDNSVSNEELVKAGLFNKDDEGNEIPIREFRSQCGIGQYYEQIIFPLGISVGIKNADFITKDKLTLKYWENILVNYQYIDKDTKKVIDLYEDNMFRIKFAFCQSEKIDIQNDIVFENGGSEWITGLLDDNVNLPSNWIRAGNKSFEKWGDNNYSGSSPDNIVHTRNDFNLVRQEDFFFPSKSVCDKPVDQFVDRSFKDYEGKFGTLCNGTWAPYVLTSPYYGGPQAKYTKPESGFDTLVLQKVGPPPEYWLYRLELPSFNPPKSKMLFLPESFGQGRYNYYDFGVGDNKIRPYNGITHIEFQPGYNQTMTNLYSVDIVLTPDKSLWTRSIVLEACGDFTKSEGGALKNEPRRAKSVDKDGKPDNSKDGFGPNGDEGMGWFPGYAVNIETGERLNIMFSENSDINLEKFGSLVNGRDMKFNPTSTYAMLINDLQLGTYTYEAGTTFTKTEYDAMFQNPYIGPDVLEEWGIQRIWGGMHYVYVCNSSGNTCPAFYLINNPTVTASLYTSPLQSLPTNFLKGFKRNFNLSDTTFTTVYRREWGGFLDKDKKYPYFDCGTYDECRWLVQKFKSLSAIHSDSIVRIKNTKMQLYNNVMYTHIPMQPSDPDLQSKWLSCDVTYKLRVTRPYMRYISRWYDSPEARNKDYSVPDEFAKFQGFPVYKLSTRGMEPAFEDTRVFNSILENINIVPNPYICFDTYERNALTTMVKITNLPTDLKNNAQVTINIYTVSGILVRTLTKGDSETAFVNWDLKNHANIPIASGVYLIHVNCPGIGERILKFFCTMRQTDLNQF